MHLSIPLQVIADLHVQQGVYRDLVGAQKQKERKLKKYAIKLKLFQKQAVLDKTAMQTAIAQLQRDLTLAKSDLQQERKVFCELSANLESSRVEVRELGNSAGELGQKMDALEEKLSMAQEKNQLLEDTAAVNVQSANQREIILMKKQESLQLVLAECKSTCEILTHQQQTSGSSLIEQTEKKIETLMRQHTRLVDAQGRSKLF